MVSETLYTTLLKTLHSNLVIFKLIAAACAVCKFVIFTFQSGYIQIRLKRCHVITYNTLHSNLVIFKFLIFIINSLADKLYIPIWLYSNWETMYKYNL